MISYTCYEDTQLDSSRLRKAILNARTDKADIFCDSDREHFLELLLEMKLRGITPYSDIPEG